MRDRKIMRKTKTERGKKEREKRWNENEKWRKW
jgi:hypothetical protein